MAAAKSRIVAPHDSNGHTRSTASSLDNPASFIKSMSGSRVKWGIMSPEQEWDSIHKSQRADAARDIDIRIPLGYHAQVRKAWEMYEADRLFRYLVDRSTDFAANGFEWEVPIPEYTRRASLVERVKKAFTPESAETKRFKKEKQVWDAWATKLNFDVPNVIPGIDEIIKWQMKHLQLNGMAPMEWEWDTLEVDGEKYELPMRMTVHNPLAILLVRLQNEFLQERAFQRLSLTGPAYLTEGMRTFNQVEIYMTPPQIVAGSARPSPDGFSDGRPVRGKKDGFEWKELTLLNPHNLKPEQEGFVLKYNWTPGDNSVLMRGKYTSVGQGLYPSVPFSGLFSTFMKRQALDAADLAILDGVIEYILDWEIGDGTTKDESGHLINHPQPEKRKADGTVIQKSTVDLVKEMVTQDTKGRVMQLFRPYWVKPKVLIPNVETLLSHEKYTQPTLEMYASFGILMTTSGSAGGGSMRALAVNTSNFEQMVEGLRKAHVRRFWEMLGAQIVRRNKGKFSTAPHMVFNQLNTQDAAFRNSLLQIAKLGRISTETLLQAHGLDKRTEFLRVANEIESGETQFFDDNVPVGFAQTVKTPSGKETTEQPATTTTGRPQQQPPPKGGAK